MKKVTIKEKDLISLLEDRFNLQALENAGVDNWGSYSDLHDPDIMGYEYETAEAKFIAESIEKLVIEA